MYIPDIFLDLISSKPFDELRKKCKEVSGEWLPYNNDEYGTVEMYADKLIKLAKVNWTYEIKELQNSRNLIMILNNGENWYS